MKKCSLVALSCALFWTLPALGGVQTPQNTRIQTYDEFIFNATDKSVWVADGIDSEDFAYKWELSKRDWQKFIGPVTNRIGVGQIVEECLLGICGKAGVFAGLKVESYFLPYLDAAFQPGTFDAAAAFKPEIKYQSSGLGLDFSSLKTQSGLQLGQETSLLVRAPSIKIDAGIKIENELSLSAQACLGGCALDESWPIYTNKFNLPLVQINTQIDPSIGEKPVVKFFNPPSGGADFLQELINAGNALADNPDQSLIDILGDAFYDDASDLLWDKARGKYIELYDEEYKNAPSADQDRIKGEAETRLVSRLDAKKAQLAQSPLSASVSNPFLEDKSVDGSLSTTIGGRLAEITLDVDQVLGLAVGLPNGGSLSLVDAGIATTVLTGELTLGNVEVGPQFDLFTEVSITPELMVHLQFDTAVLIKGEIGPQTSYTGTWENLPDIALLAPENKLDFDPTQDSIGSFFANNAGLVTATPSFFVEATVNNETFLDVNASATIELFSAEIRIPGFGTESIGPVWSKSVETDSPLATVDLYTNSFQVNDWTSGGEQELNSPGATAYQVSDGAGASTAIDDGSLSFSSGGEVVFQARRRCTICDDYNDSFTIGDVVSSSELRVGPELFTNQVRLANNALQPYGRNVFDESFLRSGSQDEAYLRLKQQYFPYFIAYDLTNTDVKDAVHGRLQIQPGQMAQVMLDGRLRINGEFVVEAGGLFELGTDPLGLTAFLAQDRGVFNQPSGVWTVHGSVYSATGADKQAQYAQSGSLKDAFAVVNEANLNIGYTGSVKLDGVFANTGRVNNHGALEFTSTDAQSTGVFYNGHGGEVDVFGSLAAHSAQNRATMTVHSGGSLLLSDFGDSIGGQAQLQNFGELLVHSGGRLEIAHPRQTTPASEQDYLLENRFVVDNRGLLRNLAGGTLVNGAAGYDWEQWTFDFDVLGAAREQRASALSGQTSLLAEQNDKVLKAVFGAEVARQNFVSESNIAVSGFEAALRPLSMTQANQINTLLTKTEAFDDATEEYLDAKNDPGNFLFGIDYCGNGNYLFCQTERNNYVAAKSDYEDALDDVTDTQSDMRFEWALIVNTTSGAEREEQAFGNALVALEGERGAFAGQLTAIDIAIYQDSQSGFGLLRNGAGGLLVNESTITNFAVLENAFGAAFYNEGALTNHGLFKNHGEWVNQPDATVVNSGLLKNGLAEVGAAGFSQTVNLGAIDNSGLLVNHDTLVNYGTLVNQGASAGQPFVGTVHNTGQLDNVGELTNNGELDNDFDGNLSNHGLLVNNGTITNWGAFTNGAHAAPAAGQNPLAFEQLANSVYSARQSRAETQLDLARLQEELQDSRARTRSLNSSVPLFFIPFGDQDSSGYFNQQEFDNILAQRAESKAYYATLESNLASRILAAETYLAQDVVALDLALLDSASVATLDNNGSFLNIGVLNNLGTITNSASGEIFNRGIVMVSEGASIDNLGRINIASGLLMNGVLTQAERQAATTLPDTRITNAGTIALSARITADANGAVVFNNALLVNNATLTNADGGLFEIGGLGSADFGGGKIYSTNALRNYGLLTNENGASLINRGTLFNAGEIENQTGSSFASTGLLNNTGLITFADSVVLGGSIENGEATPTGAVLNNGLIVTAETELLTLTGGIAGSGEFSGNTLVQNATVSPGNSAGLLTFTGDVVFDGVELMLEVFGSERGISYDAIDITGSLTLDGPLNLNIFSYLEFDALLAGQALDFISVGGDLLDASGAAFNEASALSTLSLFRSDDFGGWEGAWKNGSEGWNLFFEYTGAEQDYEIQYRELLGANTTVPLPPAVFLLAPALLTLGLRRRRTCA
jgi:hypothetical protein